LSGSPEHLKSVLERQLERRVGGMMTAIADDPWRSAMQALDFERAWAISDRFMQAAPADKHAGPRHLQRIWRGEPLQGKCVLVRCYHGLGDTIQFVRFMAPLRKTAREVILWCQPELVELMRPVAGIDRILPLHDGAVAADFDADIEIMEVPHALRVKPCDVGANVPYLARSSSFASSFDGRLRVGLVGQAGGWDPQRSIPSSALNSLFMLPNIRFCSLQLADSSGPLRIESRAATSIEALARYMERLDVVITVDTMVAHLAGGLGLRVWTMLRAECDWRWGASGEHCVWYPTMRLFRQAAPGDWSVPLGAVRSALVDLQECVVRRRTEERVQRCALLP
jgi:hypothetical protein